MQFHNHYSSDSKQTTARKHLLNLLLHLGICSASRNGLTVYFGNCTVHLPGAYAPVKFSIS